MGGATLQLFSPEVSSDELIALTEGVRVVDLDAWLAAGGQVL